MILVVRPFLFPFQRHIIFIAAGSSYTSRGSVGVLESPASLGVTRSANVGL